MKGMPPEGAAASSEFESTKEGRTGIAVAVEGLVG